LSHAQLFSARRETKWDTTSLRSQPESTVYVTKSTSLGEIQMIEYVNISDEKYFYHPLC
jgi:hypothetical protein